jgi:hypothetical protein
MRTTVRLDDELLAAAKRRAADTGRTLTDVIADALRRELAVAPATAASGPVELPTFGGNGLQPGVDLDDTAGLLDLMEAGADPS